MLVWVKPGNTCNPRLYDEFENLTDYPFKLQGDGSATFLIPRNKLEPFSLWFMAAGFEVHPQ